MLRIPKEKSLAKPADHSRYTNLCLVNESIRGRSPVALEIAGTGKLSDFAEADQLIKAQIQYNGPINCGLGEPQEGELCFAGRRAPSPCEVGIIYVNQSSGEIAYQISLTGGLGHGMDVGRERHRKASGRSIASRLPVPCYIQHRLWHGCWLSSKVDKRHRKIEYRLID